MSDAFAHGFPQVDFGDEGRIERLHASAVAVIGDDVDAALARNGLSNHEQAAVTLRTLTFGCEYVKIFEVYQAEGPSEGKKSLALTMTFRATDHTLKLKNGNATSMVSRKSSQIKLAV